MALEPEAAKKVILDFFEAKSKSKSKFYFNDFTKLFPEEKARAVKKILTMLIQEGTLEFWSDRKSVV